MLDVELLESVLFRERSNTLKRRAFSTGSAAVASCALECGIESGIGMSSGEPDSRAEVYDEMELAVSGGVCSIAAG